MNLSSLRLASYSALLAAAGLASCATTESAPYGQEGGDSGSNTATNGSGGATGTATGTAATTSPGTTTGTQTTTTDAGTTTTGASATTAGGATATTTTDTSTTGGDEEVFDCSNRPMVTIPALTDFESYDGATDLLDWGFPINDDGSGDVTNVRYMGLYDGSDGTGSPTLLIKAGNASNYAVEGANTEATEWGGGVGFWINCINATMFTGITMAVQGSSPQGTATIALNEEDASGEAVSYTTKVTLSDAWTVVQIAFSELMNIPDGETTGPSATGDNITGLNIGADMVWVESSEGADDWHPEPAPYSIQVDDLAFY